MVTADTSVFGYLMPNWSKSRLVNLYSRFIAADPSAMVVPLVARMECLESAIHNVRTGLIQGMLVDSSLYSIVSNLVDALTTEASVSGVIDTIFVAPQKGTVIGDCSAVKAIASLTDSMEVIPDPVVLMYGGDWETRVAMTALSGRDTLMEIAAAQTADLDAIPTGCVVEYAGDEKVTTDQYDLVVNPPDGFSPAPGQSILSVTTGNPVKFEATRLAYAVGRFRGLSKQICLDTAKNYEKNLHTV